MCRRGDADTASVRDNGCVTSVDPTPAAEEGVAQESQSEASRPRRLALFMAVAGFALVLDLISKVLVVAKLGEGHPPVRILAGAIYLVETRNSGAAFSFGTGAT